MLNIFLSWEDVYTSENVNYATLSKIDKNVLTNENIYIFECFVEKLFSHEKGGAISITSPSKILIE